MGNVLLRRVKQWYNQTKQGSVVRDGVEHDVTHAHQEGLYYEFEFVIDPVVAPTATNESIKKQV